MMPGYTGDPSDEKNDYTPEEQEFYDQLVASQNIPWLADSVIVARRNGRAWEDAALRWKVKYETLKGFLG